MAAAGHLNERRIAALRPTPGRRQDYLWEQAIPGFGVRVSQNGIKAFVLKYRLHSGRVRWKTLGRVGTMALEVARRRAKTDLGQVADGRDPMRMKDAARDGVTFGAVADRWLEDHVDVRRKPATRRLYRTVLENHLRPRLGTMPITDITATDLLKVHHRLRGTRHMANRVVAVASALFNWSAHAGFRTGPNPCDGIEKYPERARKRYLTPQELARVGAALRVAERRHALAPSAVAAMRLLLLTGARVSEILALQWKFVDLQRGALRLPDSKTGAKVILLNAPARDILAAVPRWATSPYVFPGEGRGKRKGTHRVNLADAWTWVRRRAKVPDVRLHDLRHSFASVAVSHGLSLPTIGALLGHSQAQTTHRYAHLLDDPLRAANDQTGATIGAALVRRAKR